MNARKLFFIGLLVILILTACGGGDGDKPVDVVKNVVNAMEDLDTKEASKYFCDEYKAELEGALDSGFEELEALGMDPDELLEAFKINMDDMEYEEKSKDGDKAVVNVKGKMSLEFDTDKLKGFVKKAAEASGQEVSDEEVDFLVGMLGAMGGQEVPFDGDVELVKEDGDWVVCDELDFLNEMDLGF